MGNGTLYIVATPIGNMKDITLRALEILKASDLIVAEDTRVSTKLLSHYGIQKKLISFHVHSKESRLNDILTYLQGGKTLSYITDAGTPGISDPGSHLVSEVKRVLGEDFNIEAIPGPSAVTTALSIAGLPSNRFIFYGFIPHKKGRKKLLKEISENTMTSILYESPHRIIKTLFELSSLLSSNRKVILFRELTKKFSTTHEGSVSGVLEKLKKDVIKGEFVLLISGKKHEKNI